MSDKPTVKNMSDKPTVKNKSDKSTVKNMLDKPTVNVVRKSIDFASESPVFENVPGLLDPPMEISPGKIPGINMMDETIICRKPVRGE